MDIISFNEAATANGRIEKVIAQPDSVSGLVTMPSVVATGEVISIPTGRTVVHPNLQVDGILDVHGTLFIPSGGSVSTTEVDATVVKQNGNVVANDSTVVHKTGDETIAGVKTFSSSPIVPNATTATQAMAYGQGVNLTAAQTIAGVKTLSDGLNIGLVSVKPVTGSIIINPTSTVPSGYLECNGATLSRATYALLFEAIGTLYGVGDGSTTFAIPDLRGEFIRGFDNGRGVDASRVVGSSQTDAFKSHTHTISNVIQEYGQASAGLGSYNFVRWGSGNNSGINNTGSTETRPRNIAMMYCIKY